MLGPRAEWGALGPRAGWGAEWKPLPVADTGVAAVGTGTHTTTGTSAAAVAAAVAGAVAGAVVAAAAAAQSPGPCAPTPGVASRWGRIDW